MPDGPGKYDEICVNALMMTEAQACLLIVLAGNQGSGFSVNTVHPEVTRRLPALLREVADKIQADIDAANERMS